MEECQQRPNFCIDFRETLCNLPSENDLYPIIPNNGTRPFHYSNLSSVDRTGGILLDRKGAEDAKERWIKMGNIVTNYGPFQQTIISIGRDLGLVATLWFYCIGFLNHEVL